MDYSKMKESLTSTVFFRPADGENRIRVVTEPIQLWKVAPKTGWVKGSVRTYLSESSVKQANDEKVVMRFICYIFNRSLGNKLQIAEFGPQVMEKFINYAVSSEYGFESIPDSDMILVKSGAGMETSYDLQIARKPSELTAGEALLLEQAKPIMQILREDETVVWEEPVTNQAEAPKNEIDLSQVPF
jgi:hypothetical protein